MELALQLGSSGNPVRLRIGLTWLPEGTPLDARLTGEEMRSAGKSPWRSTQLPDVRA